MRLHLLEKKGERKVGQTSRLHMHNAKRRKKEEKFCVSWIDVPINCSSTLVFTLVHTSKRTGIVSILSLSLFSSTSLSLSLSLSLSPSSRLHLISCPFLSDSFSSFIMRIAVDSLESRTTCVHLHHFISPCKVVCLCLFLYQVTGTLYLSPQ